MKLSFASTLVVTLAVQGAVADTWFGKPAYHKWQQTELERWLSDNDVAYSKSADRKALENLVKENWNDKVVAPYNGWSTQALLNYLTASGKEAKKGTEKNTKALAEQVKEGWTETTESANQAYESVQNWIFDAWSDSQLEAFAHKHGIPVPEPRKRDTLLKNVRENYQSAANKVSETAHYPGDWLYESWSESDLRAFLEDHGIAARELSTREQLIASIRRNSRLIGLNAQSTYSSITSSAASAQQSLSDAIFDTWSDSQIKEWADKNGIKVPQGSKRNELIALARKHRASFTGDNVSASAASAYGAATTSAGNQYAAATNGFAGYTNWIKAQIGLATGPQASASLVSASASKNPTRASSSASKSASSASSSIAKSATQRVKEEL